MDKKLVIDLSDDDATEHSDNEEAKKPFRFNARRALFTYSQANTLTKEFIQEAFKVFGCSKYVIGEEPHKNGGKHFHVYARFTKKLNTKNPRFFDIGEYHPNIKIVKTELGALEYCMKHGDWISSDGIFSEVFPNSMNFNKKYNDHVAWSQKMELFNLKKIVFPFTLPDQKTQVFAADEANKKRHWFITGPPNYGKTWWVNETFASQSVYVVPNDTDFPFESYIMEEVIVFDDYDLLKKGVQEWILSASNTWWVAAQVPGKVRYRSNYWPLGKSRIIIILCNDLPVWAIEGRFASRFNVLDMSICGPYQPQYELEDVLHSEDPTEEIVSSDFE